MDEAAPKKIFLAFTAGMTAYVLGIDVANHIHGATVAVQFLLVLLPVLPMIYVCFRYIVTRDSDEMWRKSLHGGVGPFRALPRVLPFQLFVSPATWVRQCFARNGRFT